MKEKCFCRARVLEKHVNSMLNKYNSMRWSLGFIPSQITSKMDKKTKRLKIIHETVINYSYKIYLTILNINRSPPGKLKEIIDGKWSRVIN